MFIGFQQQNSRNRQTTESFVCILKAAGHLIFKTANEDASQVFVFSDWSTLNCLSKCLKNKKFGQTALFYQFLC